jgi:hypothetical protein
MSTLVISYTRVSSYTGIALLCFFCVVFIVHNVSFIVCVALCPVFCLSVVCYFVRYVYFCVSRLLVVPVPQGKPPFAVHLNNNRENDMLVAINIYIE